MLIWGASGGLGSYATRFTLNGGAIPGLRRLLPGEGRDLPRMGAKHIIDRSAELGATDRDGMVRTSRTTVRRGRPTG